MGAEISTKSFDIRARKDCTLEKYLRIRYPVRGDYEALFSNNNNISNKYYKVQLKEVCSKGYYPVYRAPVPVTFSGNIISSVTNYP